MFEIKNLNYEKNEFENVISSRTFEFHHDKHYTGYVNKLNELINGTEFENESLVEIIKKSWQKNNAVFNNAGQVYNHEFYFENLKNNSKISPAFLQLINDNFESFEKFCEAFTNSAVSNFGSGWTWLTENNKTKKLEIISTTNAIPCWIVGDYNPLFVVDVWEHAYYLDYQNLRAKYVGGILSILDWEKIEKNLI